MPNYLVHHGIQGQKWGVRNYQNYDGTLTPEGRLRYAKNSSYVGKAATRVGKTVLQTAIAYAAPAVVAGAAAAVIMLANPAIGALAAGDLLGVASAAATGVGTVGAGASIVANGYKFVKDMIAVHGNRQVLAADDERIRSLTNGNK